MWSRRIQLAAGAWLLTPNDVTRLFGRGGMTGVASRLVSSFCKRGKTETLYTSLRALVVMMGYVFQLLQLVNRWLPLQGGNRASRQFVGAAPHFCITSA